MKKALKVVVFTVAFLAVAAAAVFGYYTFMKTDFSTVSGSKSGTVEITGYNGSAVNIKIPKRIQGKKVVAIGKDAFIKTEIQSVTLPDSVVTIRSKAFDSCTKLKSVTFGNGLETIDEMAFNGCTALEALRLPASLKTIGDGAFVQCDNLKEIQPEDGGAFVLIDGVLFNQDQTKAFWAPDTIDFSDYAFPGTVKEYAAYFFMGHEELTSVVIPEGMTVLPKSLLGNCTNLQEVTLPSTLKKIDETAFWNCTSLKKLRIPSSVSSFGDSVFSQNGVTNLDITLVVEEGSAAYTYAKENKLHYELAK